VRVTTLSRRPRP